MDYHMKTPAITELVIPRFFTEQDHFPFLQVDNFSYVKYHNRSNQYRNQIIATSYLFAVVLSGEKIIHTADGDLHIGKGEAFFAQKGTYLFSEILASHDEYRALIFFIDHSFLERFLKRHFHHLGIQSSNEHKDIFTIPIAPLLEFSINSVLPYFEHHTKFSQELLQLKLEELLLHIINADPNENFISFLRSQYSTSKRELQSLMEKYCLKRVTIAELATLSGRSLSAFKRDFKESFATTPRRWITNRRLDHARMLLTGSNLSVSEICFAVGFASFSHFSQIFKNKFGFPPSSLQKVQN